MFAPSVLAAAALASSPVFMDCAPGYLASLLLARIIIINRVDLTA